MALQNAIAFANGTRWDGLKGIHQSDGQGFEAYEIWRTAVDSGVAQPKYTLDHARELTRWRKYAATYLLELAKILPPAKSKPKEGAAHYDRLTDTAARLQALCEPLKDSKSFSEDIALKHQHL